MQFDLAQLRARFSTTAASPRNGRGGGQGHPLRSNGSKGVEMIIAETTIATSVSATADMSMQSLARKTAITLVLSVAKSMTQATLLSEMTPKGARATVHALAPEPATVALTVTPMVTRRDQSDQLRMLAAIHIEVTAEISGVRAPADRRAHGLRPESSHQTDGRRSFTRVLGARLRGRVERVERAACLEAGTSLMPIATVRLGRTSARAARRNTGHLGSMTGGDHGVNQRTR